MQQAPALKITLLPAATIAATQEASYDQNLHRYRELIVTWDITAAEDDTTDETYDLYITTSDGLSSWDLCHFPQVTADGAKRYVARILADLLPQTVASNGTASNEGILETVSANAVGSLSAGDVRHGKWGNEIGYKLVIAGTIATGITCSVQVEAR